VLRRFAYLLLWFVLTPEMEGHVFAGLWSTPLTTVGTLLFTPIKGLHIIPFDAMVVITTLLAAPSAPWKNVRPVLDSMLITVGACFGVWLWGMLRGGSAYQTIFQLRPFAIGLIVTLMLLATTRTMAHIESLLRIVVLACVYRSVTVVLFYIQIVQHLDYDLPTLTDHVDSVLFVSGFLILLINALERRALVTWLVALVGIGLSTAAMALNNRRIAWLGVAVGLGMLYLVMPPGKLKKRVTRVLIALSPLLVAYVVAGWGKKEGIFKPVGSISSMFGQHQDVSSIMRDIENYNLVRTLGVNPLLGVGWGHQYVEEIQAWDISSLFPQYRYLPHNSYLGVIAFTGMLGFAGLWQLVPVAAFLHARVLVHGAKERVPRVAAQSGLLMLMMVTIEMWGDVGFNHHTVTSMMGVAIAVGGRVAAMTGVSPARTVQRRGQM
jgi:hypothetical protein